MRKVHVAITIDALIRADDDANWQAIEDTITQDIEEGFRKGPLDDGRADVEDISITKYEITDSR